jgi:hypothetical protein
VSGGWNVYAREVQRGLGIQLVAIALMMGLSACGQSSDDGAPSVSPAAGALCDRLDVLLKTSPLNENEIVSEFRYRLDDVASSCPSGAKTVERLVAAHDAAVAASPADEMPLTDLQAQRACRVGRQMIAEGVSDREVSDYYDEFTLESKMLLPGLCPHVMDFYRDAQTRLTEGAGSGAGNGSGSGSGSRLPPPANDCEAQTDYLGEEFDAGNLTESEYDQLLDENWDTCYANLPD